MTDTLKFNLSSPIKAQLNIDGKHEIVDVDLLYCKAPTYKHKDYTIDLKKRFIEAIFAMTNSLSRDEAQKAVESDEDKTMDAKSIKAVLFAAKDFDIVSFFKKFEKFLLADICFKDEEYKQTIKSLDLQKMDETDFEELLAKYLEVFFIASWMKTLS